MTDDLFQKNTRKYDIFFRSSEKKVFSKRAAPGHDLSFIMWKDGFFSQKQYFFLGQEGSDDVYQEMRGNMIFSVYSVGVTNLTLRPPVKKKIKDGLIPQQYT